MTHHTDAERAEFEAMRAEFEAIFGPMPRGCTWTERGYCHTEFGAWDAQNFDHKFIGFVAAWKAARRAPAAPVPQNVATHNKNLNGFIDFANQIDFAKPRSASLKRKLILETRDAILDLFNEQLKLHRKIDALAAAPKPPEAAPVQMPEPVAYVHTPSVIRQGQVRPVVSFQKYEDDYASGIYSLRTPLYTEQQVRELLAAQASVSNGTLPDTQSLENIREGAPYNNPEFEQLARDLGVWGTAQSALCAQFWMAAKERKPLTDEQIEAAAKCIAESLDYPWSGMVEGGRESMRSIAKAAIERAHGIGVDKP